jgi:bifunctional non-homologous end joining protein LigD
VALDEYWRKRNFQKTPEPPGKVVRGSPSGDRERFFCVQKHAASHLHYDFRLELEGVLKSWAVPKGPSIDPEVRRLAMMTEDHPFEYGEFEGVIPAGQYGGGTVMLWDVGTWVPLEENPHQAIRAGKLKFELRGEKLKGSFALVRTDERRWHLMKLRDKLAKKIDITEKKPLSVATGRDLDEIAEQRDREWHSNRGDDPGGERPGVKPNHLTNPDKLLWRKDKITKLELVEYYIAVGDLIVREVKGRPLTLVRASDAIEDGTIYMRHSKVWGPKALRRITIKEKTKVGEYLVADDLLAVLGLVQMSIVEIHTWNCVDPDIDRPDRLIFDFDPDEAVPWRRVVEAAQLTRERLSKLGLESLVKTTGGKGLHVVVPLKPSADWELCLDFARAFSESIAREDPRGFTTAMPKDRRRGRILIDYLRNNRANTSVAAYSTRARAGAPVSMPVSWTELPKIDPNDYTLFTVPQLIAKRKRDPWKGYDGLRTPLLKALTSRITSSAKRRSSSGRSA